MRFNKLAWLIGLVVVLAALAVRMIASADPASAPATAASGPASAPAALSSRVDVREFGAKADGNSDDTAAFAHALAAVSTRGGIVFVPAGNYRISTHIEVPAGVSLEGVWVAPTSRAEHHGSTLLAVEGAGSEQGPAFITLGANATLKGISVFYPDQRPEKIVPYPWCIAGAGGDGAAIIDCLLINPYQAVDFGSRPSGRHYIRNLYGQPLRRGLFIDKCFDIGRIENVHFWPFWTWDEKSGIQNWLQTNGEAFIFARADWEYVLNTYCYGYIVGYHFIQSKDGPTNGNLVGIGADASNVAVMVEATQPSGLLITNGEFVSFTGEKPTQVVVTDSHVGSVQFQNCAFWGTAYQVARVAGAGAVSFNNCNFVEWANSIPAIDLSGGNLIVNGCSFGRASPQAILQSTAQSAIFSANRFTGPFSVANPAKANLQAGLNVEKK